MNDDINTPGFTLKRIKLDTPVDGNTVSTIFLHIDPKAQDAYLKANNPDVHDAIKQIKDNMNQVMAEMVAGEEWKITSHDKNKENLDDDWIISGPYYEVMAFGPSPFEGAQQRFQTEAEALVFHQELIDNIKSALLE